MSITDEMLVSRAQDGDLEAEETLMRKYKKTVKLKARPFYMVGADEEDVVQEGMIGLFKAIRRYSPERHAGFATFAGVCITRQIIDAIRAAGRKKHIILNESMSLNNPVGCSNEGLTIEDTIRDGNAVDPEALSVIKDLIHYILHNEKDMFSDYERQVLQELMKGSESEKIAKMFGKSGKSVDNTIRRIKKKIAAYILA